MAKTFFVFGVVFSFLSIRFVGFNLRAYLGSVQTHDLQKPCVCNVYYVVV